MAINLGFIGVPLRAVAKRPVRTGTSREFANATPFPGERLALRPLRSYRDWRGQSLGELILKGGSTVLTGAVRTSTEMLAMW
jgi:hypothetical protein